MAGFPAKLVIFRIAASSFYWTRYYHLGKIYKRSTRTANKREAFEFAKRFYDEINYKQHVGLLRGKTENFVACVREVLKSQHFLVLAGEMSADMAKADEYRLNKEIASYFKEYRIDKINYALLESFMHSLIEKKLTSSTIANYMGLISKTLKYAHRRELISSIPQIPKPKRVDRSRGWLDLGEYLAVWRTARRLRGKIFEVRLRKFEDGRQEFFTSERILPTVFERARSRRENDGKLDLTDGQKAHIEEMKHSRFFRKAVIDEELADLICFMVNSFIRPSDLKLMKHKHIDVIRAERTYLRLRLPESKKHDKPIATMSAAVRVYERLKARNAKVGLASADDYVFSPHIRANANSSESKQREKAIRQLQQQFRVVLELTNLLTGANGEERSLYSLRHTSIMFRLLYGEGVDVLTLAVNARTSIDMLQRFYVSHLTGELNIDMLHSRRRR